MCKVHISLALDRRLLNPQTRRYNVILCAHVRTIANKKKFLENSIEESDKYPINEIQTIIDLLFRKFDGKSSIFKNEQKDLKSIFLYQISFMTMGESTTTLNNVNFYDARLNDVNFMYIELNNTSLLGGDFM